MMVSRKLNFGHQDTKSPRIISSIVSLCVFGPLWQVFGFLRRYNVARCFFFSLFLLLSVIALPIHAEERILSYHSDIEISADS